MSIAKHVHSLQQHLARLGLQAVPVEAPGGQSEVFRICFLNKYELQQWKQLHQTPDDAEDQHSQNLSIKAAEPAQ